MKEGRMLPGPDRGTAGRELYIRTTKSRAAKALFFVPEEHEAGGTGKLFLYWRILFCYT